MLKKLTILLSCFAFIISSSSLASFADYFYGAFYVDGKEPRYKVAKINQGNKSSADFIMKFTKMPDEKHLETYCISINKRFKKYGRFNYETNKWPFILHGTYNNIPIIKDYDRHHIVSAAAIEKSISKKASVKAPAITLRKSLHRETSSYGNSNDAKDHRGKEAQNIKDYGMKKATKNGLGDLDSISKISIAGTSVMETGSYSCLNGDSFISGINEPSTILGSHKLGTNMPIEEDWETYGFNEPSTILGSRKLGTNMPIEEDWETYDFNEPSTILEQHKPD